MSLFKKVLYSTDFSPLAEYAFSFVKKLKSAGLREVVIVHVVNELSVDLPEGLDVIRESETVDVLSGSDREYLLNVIERANVLKRDLEEENISVNLKVIVATNAANCITNVAKKEGVNVIVLGAHGKGLVKRFVLGSVSNDVVKKAECPVLLIKKKD